MAALYDINAWALEALRAADHEVMKVYRVYQPVDPSDGPAEVLFENGGDVFTALIEPDGRVLATCSGW